MQFLLITQTDYAVVVNLSAQSDVLVQIVLSSNTDFGGVVPCTPRQLNASTQIRTDFVVNRTAVLCAVTPEKCQLCRKEKMTHA